MTIQAFGDLLHLVAFVVRPTTMNMLKDKGDNFYPLYQSYSHLSQIEWNAVKRFSSTIGQEAVDAMLSALGTDGQHAIITKFI